MTDVDTDDLHTNPLFVLFLSSVWYNCAPDQQLVIVVPPAASLSSIGKVTKDVLDSHVLRLSPYYQSQYITMNNRSVVFNEQQQTLSMNGSGRTVRVTGEELYYDDTDKSFSVLRTNLPLDGKVDPAYYTTLVDNAATDDKAIERRSVAESETFLNKMLHGGGPAGPTVAPSPPSSPAPSSLSSPSSSSSSSAVSPVDSSLVSVALDRFVAQFNHSYVLVKGYIGSAAMKVNSACQRLTEEAIQRSKQVNKDFGVRKNAAQEVAYAVEAVIHAGIYAKLFAGLCALLQEEEQQLQDRVSALRSVTQDQIGIRAEIRCDPSDAIQMLATLGSYHTPMLKLVRLEQVATAITQAVQRARQQQHKRQQQEEEEEEEEEERNKQLLKRSSPSSPDSAEEEDTETEGDVTREEEASCVLSAEDLIPLFVYVLIQSNLQQILPHLQYLIHFSPSSHNSWNTGNTGSVDHLLVNLATFQAATQFIQSGEVGQLRIHTPTQTTTTATTVHTNRQTQQQQQQQQQYQQEEKKQEAEHSRSSPIPTSSPPPPLGRQRIPPRERYSSNPQRGKGNSRQQDTHTTQQQSSISPALGRQQARSLSEQQSKSSSLHVPLSSPNVSNGLGDFLSRLRLSDEVVTGSLPQMQQ